MTHTPGPWRDGGSEKDGKFTTYFVSSPPNCIASCSERDGSSEANARLIAAAPELLAAAVRADRELSRLSKELGDWNASEQKTLCNLRDAIAKATS